MQVRLVDAPGIDSEAVGQVHAVPLKMMDGATCR
jgi:hypothetical protein